MLQKSYKSAKDASLSRSIYLLNNNYEQKIVASSKQTAQMNIIC